MIFYDTKDNVLENFLLINSNSREHIEKAL